MLQTKQVARMSEMMMITGKALKQAHRRPIIITTVLYSVVNERLSVCVKVRRCSAVADRVSIVKHIDSQHSHMLKYSHTHSRLTYNPIWNTYVHACRDRSQHRCLCMRAYSYMES